MQDDDVIGNQSLAKLTSIHHSEGVTSIINDYITIKGSHVGLRKNIFLWKIELFGNVCIRILWLNLWKMHFSFYISTGFNYCKQTQAISWNKTSAPYLLFHLTAERNVCTVEGCLKLPLCHQPPNFTFNLSWACSVIQKTVTSLILFCFVLFCLCKINNIII